MSEEPKTANQTGRKSRKYVAIAAVAVLAVGGVFGVQAFADTKAYAHMKQFAASEYGGWHGGKGRHFGGPGGMLASMSDAEIEAQIGRMVKHVAIEIDATPEQAEKITALIAAVARDMKPVHEDMHAAGREIRSLLTAETVDREALEKLRAERLAEADRLSRDLIDTLADVAEVLTVEQRKVLDERIEQFREMRGRWRRG